MRNDAIVDATLIDFRCWWATLVELSIHNTPSLVRLKFFPTELLYLGE